jgi:putative membrane protein
VTRPRVAIALGVMILVSAWLPILHGWLGGGFAAHMTAHMLVVAVAAPLLALGVSGTRLDPVVRASWLGASIPASLVELAAVSAWHAPALHHAARHRLDVYAAEQASFLLAGLWLWTAVLGGGPSGQLARAGSSVVALLLTFAHMTLLGALLSLSPRSLYGHGDPSHGPVALADQQLGGSIMLAFGAIYVAGGLGLARSLIREPRAAEATP